MIPVSFEVVGGDDGQTSGFLRRTTDENGNATTEFVEADLYEKTTTDAGQEVYYVDEDTFSKGDVIQMTDSSQTYTIGDAAVLEGVYCTNLGYAQFRKTDILDQNEEYAIVAENTDYGISQYDYIVRDGIALKQINCLFLLVDLSIDINVIQAGFLLIRLCHSFTEGIFDDIFRNMFFFLNNIKCLDHILVFDFHFLFSPQIFTASRIFSILSRPNCTLRNTALSR